MPALTMANQISLVKRLARANSGYLTETYTDDVARRYVNMGVEEFVKEAGAPSKEDYIDVTPSFDTRTTWAVRVTIVGGTNAMTATDVAVTGTDQDDTTGTQVASDFETTLQAAIGAGASATVSWSTTTWKFTIDAADSTSITIESPSGATYVDATESLFGKTGTETGTTWTSNFPQDCTVLADLPSDFYQMEHAEWDGYPLYRAPFELFMSPETQTTRVQYYAVRGKKLYLAPAPTERKMLKVRYRYLPASVTLTGSSDTTACVLDDEDHMAPVFYAAGMVLRETFEPEESEKLFGQFFQMARKKKIVEANQNSKMFPKVTDMYVPKVNVD
jgi:hypothetical protein